MMRYTSLVANSPTPDQLAASLPLQPFCPSVTDFVAALSHKLVTDPDVRTYPELVALGYWMRPASIRRLQASLALDQTPLRVPRGTVLHIAPSNVDTIFVYSWFLSLLVGNCNIVRLSSKASPQADMLIRMLSECLQAPQNAEIAARTLLVRYEPDPATTAQLSSVCDVRVIWGGDATIRQIREIPLPPTAIELSFANKYSLALIHSGGWSRSNEQQRRAWIDGFFNDAFWFDQMACSSPRLVLWVGDSSGEAREDFWERLAMRVNVESRRFEDADYINKRVAVDAMAIENTVAVVPTVNNDITRVWLSDPALLDTRHCGAGLFHEAHLPTLDALRPLLQRKVQTVSYAGFQRDDIVGFVNAAPLRGIDRFVPFGSALNFASVWDGFDLADMFMRKITID